MTPSKEDRNQFFAQYWGQEVVRYGETSATWLVDYVAMQSENSYLVLRSPSEDAACKCLFDSYREQGYAMPFRDWTVEQMINFGWLRLEQ